MNPVGQGQDVIATPRCKFVNTMRGSCFTEITFDDLELEFSPLKEITNQPRKCMLDLSDEVVIEDEQDQGCSKIIREVLSVKNDDINLPWLKWDIKDVTPFKSQPKEAKSHPRSRFDMARYTDLQNDEELLIDNWRERTLISSGSLLLCRHMV